MRAYVITPEGEKQPACPRPRGNTLTPDTFTEEELQDMVGGYVEIIPLTPEVMMAVNEDRDDLPFNPYATEVMKKALPERRDFIAGKALVCLSDMVDED